MFLFAWNEWGEGVYLKPDEENKYGYLEAIKSALEICGEFPKGRIQSVVTKDVPPGVIVAGNPAKIIGSVDILAEKRREMEEIYWNSPRELMEKFY